MPKNTGIRFLYILYLKIVRLPVIPIFRVITPNSIAAKSRNFLHNSKDNTLQFVTQNNQINACSYVELQKLPRAERAGSAAE